MFCILESPHPITVSPIDVTFDTQIQLTALQTILFNYDVFANLHDVCMNKVL